MAQSFSFPPSEETDHTRSHAHAQKTKSSSTNCHLILFTRFTKRSGPFSMEQSFSLSHFGKWSHRKRYTCAVAAILSPFNRNHATHWCFTEKHLFFLQTGDHHIHEVFTFAQTMWLTHTRVCFNSSCQPITGRQHTQADITRHNNAHTFHKRTNTLLYKNMD